MPEPKSCWECSKKRRICDMGRPDCQKCQMRGIQCPGYEKKLLKWLNPGQTRSKGKRANEAPQAATFQDDYATIPISILPSDATTIMNSFQYYNEVVIPDMVSIMWSKGDRDRPFYLDRIHLPYIPPAIMEMIICSTLTHRILRVSHNMDSETCKTLARRLQEHRGKSIRLLSEELASPQFYTFSTLVCVFAFLLCEIQQCVDPNWLQHSEGAHALIEAQGGLKKLILTVIEEDMLRLFLIADLLGGTTTPYPSLIRAQRHLDAVDLLPGLFGDSLSTSVPCPAALLQSLVYINHRRAVNAVIKPSNKESFDAMMTILGQIRAVSVDEWVQQAQMKQQRVMTENDKTNSSSNDITLAAKRPDSQAWKWQQMGQIFSTATALYCVSSLFDAEQDPNLLIDMDEDDLQRHSEVLSLRESFRISLLNNLKEVSSGPVQHPRKLVLWPLVIAGIVSPNNVDKSRDFIMSELSWISRGLGSASPLVAVELLKRLWKRQDSQRLMKWDDLFDKSYVFAI